MKTDITRTTFRSALHYSAVRLQQGRVSLDADFNEQVDIGAHRDRVTTRDVVGPAGAPVANAGFKIGVAELLSAVGFSAQRGVAAGERGTLLQSADGGATWAAVASGTGEDLSGVSVVSDTNAWAVGAAATILKGNPSTSSWAAQNAPAGVHGDLRGVSFPNASRGYAVGAGATILATTDGGATWVAQPAPAGVVDDLNAVHFTSPAVGWAVGDAGRILHFSSGAWTTQTPPLGFGANLRSVHFASAQVGWAVGDGAAVLRSSDGGDTWVASDPPLDVTTALHSVDAESETVVWAAGGDGTVLHSADGGASWTQLAAPAGVDADLTGISATPGSPAVAMGDLSTILLVPAAGAWTIVQAPAPARDLSISAGRLYVDGILCENDRVVRYGAQPDYPGAPMGGAAGKRLVYIDVWQRSLTALEDSNLREVALGGPDTSTRTKTLWQVKIADPADVPAGATCATLPPDWEPASAVSTGQLRARAQPGQVQTDECMVPAAGGYRRLENQLYRVEIHTAGSGAAASYKWSRDNGSAVARLEAIDPKSSIDFSQGELTISEPGRDSVIGFAQAVYVELSDEGRALRGEPGILLTVDTVTGNAIKWKNYAGAAFSLADFPDGPTVRRWEGAAPVQVGVWSELEGGVLVEFDAGAYQVGDYWTIPARTRTATVEWPSENGTPQFRHREGVEHRYAALSFVDFDGSAWSGPTDCRDLFPPLTGLRRFFYVGGDGQEVMPNADGTLTPLPLPLEVGVDDGLQAPVAGVMVRFTIPAAGDDGIALAGGAGGLQGGAATTADVATDAHGIASCAWSLDTANEVQRVTARRLDATGTPTDVPIHFAANLSRASAVRYDPGACTGLAGMVTVQQALTTLADLTDLVALQGDGQVVQAGEALQPVVVRVANLCGAPVSAGTVHFRVEAGGGSLPNGTPDEDVALAGGQAAIDWTPGGGPGTQVLLATLTDVSAGGGALPIVSPPPQVRFTATVIESATKDPGIHVRQVRLGGVALRNDSTVPVARLADTKNGLVLNCDGPIVKAVTDKPVAIITVDLPYPLVTEDINFWGGQLPVIGFQPLVLDGSVDVPQQNSLRWRPSAATSQWLQKQLMNAVHKRGVKVLLVRLTVMGNFVYSTKKGLYLDGDAFAKPTGAAPIDWLPPSGDGRRGGNFQLWFQIR